MAQTDIDTAYVATPKLTGPLAGGALGFGRLVHAMTDADYNLLAADVANPVMEFTGTLTAGRNVVFPSLAGDAVTALVFVVFNNTTGGFSLTFKFTTGATVVVAAGKRAVIYVDNTNVNRVTADT